LASRVDSFTTERLLHAPATTNAAAANNIISVRVI
jgi:hypothetical protein